MLCTNCSDQLNERVNDDQEAKKTFNPIMVVYYIGAMLILSGFGWFLGSQWDALGAPGIFIVSTCYALFFTFVGHLLYFREKYPVAGGLLFTCAVGMVPLIVYSLEAWIGIWPSRDPGTYHNYYVWINGSWIVMEIATILAAFAGLRKIKFSFLVMPAAIAFWFLSMDLAEVLISGQLTGELRSWVSVIVGLLVLAIGYGIDKLSEEIDYAFWIYLAGLLSFWGGLTSIPDSNELGKFIYFLINAGLIVTSLKLQRKSFAVFGAFGLFGYLGHLARDIFENSMFFPIALAFIGMLMILGTVQYQKHYFRLGRVLDSKESSLI